MFRLTTTRLASGIALVILGGCASTVDPAVLQQAEAALATARQDQQVARYAPAALREAEQNYAAAQAAVGEGEDLRAQHFAYMTVRSAELAQTQARQRVAIAQRQDLANQSAELRLHASEQRADDLSAQLNARRTPTGSVIATFDLPFTTGSAQLQPGGATRLSPLVQYLRKTPGERVEIRGHTDAVGAAAFNQQLSQARANTVRDFLVAQGIDASRISTVGLGENVPVATNDTEVGRALNRRVEVEMSALPE